MQGGANEILIRFVEFHSPNVIIRRRYGIELPAVETLQQRNLIFPNLPLRTARRGQAVNGQAMAGIGAVKGGGHDAGVRPGL